MADVSPRERMRERLLRANLLLWCKEALRPSGQVPAAHHVLIIKELQAVADGLEDRLMLLLPPGSAKSTYGSKLFPAWWMWRAKQAVIGAANTGKLAEDFSKGVQAYVRDVGGPMGYNLVSDAASQWKTSTGSEYRAVGVGAAVTGFRASLGIIDDPIVDQAQVDNENFREALWDWYHAAFSTRLKPGAPLVLINTRWHADDLAGRLLEREGEKRDGGAWKVVKIRAEATEDDPLGRAPGEMLWNDEDYEPPTAGKASRPRYGDALRQTKARLEKACLQRTWYALFQQEPKPPSGTAFDPGKIVRIAAGDVPRLLRRLRAYDLAGTEKKAGRDPDWTVGLLLGLAEQNRVVILDIRRKRGTAGTIEEWIKATATEDGQAVQIFFPRDTGSSGKNYAAHLVSIVPGHDVVTERESGSKEVRAKAVSSQIEAGNVSMVIAPWNAAFIEELGFFPNGAHDDQVDALSSGYNTLFVPVAAPAKWENFSFMQR
jgi:predicted phage terminase large subunit-like protein